MILLPHTTLQITIVGLSFVGGLVIAGILVALPNILPDVPNARSSHSRVVPRGGGLGFILPFLICLLVLAVTENRLEDRGLQALFLGAVFLALLGFVDDAFSLPAAPRLFFQFIAALALCVYGAPDSLRVLGIVTVTGWPVHILQVVWILACVNLYNFMDGIDGLAAGQAVWIAAVLGSLLYLDSQAAATPLDLRDPGSLKLASLVFFCLSAGATGFLMWNLPPARVFMGDTGSYFLGFVFGFAALIFPEQTSVGRPEPVLTWTWNSAAPHLTDFTAVFVLLTPLFGDAALTLLARLRGGRHLFQAHREHMYQLLFRTGWTAARVDLLFLGAGILVLIPIVLKYLGLTGSWVFLSYLGLLAILVPIYVRAKSVLRNRLGEK